MSGSQNSSWQGLMEHFKEVLLCIIITPLPMFGAIDVSDKATSSINGDVFQLREWCIFVDEAILAPALEERAKERLAGNNSEFCWTKTPLAKNFLAIPNLVNAHCQYVTGDDF